MPIDRKRYPPDWKQTSHRIRFERAEGKCEVCKAVHGEPHPITGKIVKLQTAHLNRWPEETRDADLMAMCARCHFAYDRADNYLKRKYGRLYKKLQFDIFTPVHMLELQDKFEELMYVPRWLGLPMWPVGFPVQPDSFSISTETGGSSTTIRERINQYHLQCFNDNGDLVERPSLSMDDFEVLRQWAIYFLHAPIWAQESFGALVELQQRSWRVSTWEQLSDLGFESSEIGLDFL